MGKTTVSHRLDDELLAWATSYAKERGSTRTVVIEEGLRSLKGLSEGGVPDLPVESPQMREARAKLDAPQRAVDDGPNLRQIYASDRQAILNAAKNRKKAS